MEGDNIPIECGGGGKIHQEILEAHGPLEDGLALFVPILGSS